MSLKTVVTMLICAVGSSICAWAGTGNPWIGVSALLGITAVVWPHLNK